MEPNDTQFWVRQNRHTLKDYRFDDVLMIADVVCAFDAREFAPAFSFISVREPHKLQRQEWMDTSFIMYISVLFILCGIA